LRAAGAEGKKQMARSQAQARVHPQHTLAECGVCFATVVTALAGAAVAIQWLLRFL
jgi:hypothetical protein